MRKHRRAHVEYLMQPSRWVWAGEVHAMRKLTHTHTHTHNGRHGWSAHRRRGTSGSLGGGRAAEWAFVTMMFHNVLMYNANDVSVISVGGGNTCSSLC